MKQRKGLQLQASYTVEAAILLPLFLFAILKGLLLGIDFYHDVCTAAESRQQFDEIEPVDWIWKKEVIEKGEEYIHEHTVSEKFEEQLYGGDGAGAALKHGWSIGGKNDAASADTGTFAMGDYGERGRYDFLVSDYGAAKSLGLAEPPSAELCAVRTPSGGTFGASGGTAPVLSEVRAFAAWV